MSKTRRATRTDGEATRQRILDAAGELFAAGGYAETTGKAIAARAQVDTASINYHYKNRDGLYQAVLAEAHRQLISLDELRVLLAGDAPASERLRRLFEHVVQRSQGEGSWNIRVLAREVLSPSSHLKVLLQTEVLPKILLVRQLLSDITGIAVGDPALVRCLISVASPCGMLIFGKRDNPGPLGEALGMPGSALVNHLHTFALAGLEAISRDCGKQKGSTAAGKNSRR